ncbi:MAG: hypothetical protein JWO74_2191 [Solirubrobacterales bacterium]|jgi:hypothetical protein|nr:hypothetical protein [Solirubrobacterales bacterium]
MSESSKKPHPPPRPSASAEAATVRWSETHPDEDIPHAPPSTPREDEDEDVAPDRPSASAEAAALRLREQADDAEN